MCDRNLDGKKERKKERKKETNRAHSTHECGSKQQQSLSKLSESCERILERKWVMIALQILRAKCAKPTLRALSTYFLI
jgi:hypothetical protein